MLVLNDLIKEFVSDCMVRNLSIRTIKSYKNNLLLFSKWINIENLNDINSIKIKEYIQFKKDSGKKATYVNTIIKSLNSFYSYLLEEEYIVKNPMKRVKFLKEQKTLIMTFNDDEVKRMLSVTKGNSFMATRNRLILALFIDTGIRNLELCQLKVKNIHDNYILLNGKGNKDRAVPLSPYTIKALSKYLRYRSERNIVDEEYLILSCYGHMMTVEGNEHIVKGIGKKANVRSELRCSPHTFRHYFAQKNLMNGNDIYSISKLLGHANISITQTYLRSINDELVLKKSVQYSPLRAI